MPRGDILTDAQALEAYERFGSIEKAARGLGVSYGALQAALARVRAPKIKQVQPVEERFTGESRVYILTCAQNDTPLHQEFVENLTAYAEFRKAEIMVSRFTYDVGSYGARSVKPGQEKLSKPEPTWAPWAEERASDHSVMLAPDLRWCGEMNILPSAVRPLSGMETYTGRASGIIPHVKVAMVSTPRLLPAAPRFVYTTGTVTRPNYIQKKAGQKAEFHHVYGALIVEVAETGHWWVRQLNADASTGMFYDLQWKVEDGKVVRAEPWAGLVLGDLHEAEASPAAVQRSHAMILMGRPRVLLVHDALDWRNQSHHDRGNPHIRFLKYYRNHTSVQGELANLAAKLKWFHRAMPEGGEIVLTRSNHDEALDRWLREADFKTDPENALVYLRAQTALYELMNADCLAPVPDALPLCLAPFFDGKTPEWLRFLRRKENYTVAGIDVSQHGDEGPNGVRASPSAMERLALKAVLGHTHSAGIHDGVYWVGTLRKLNAEYTRGATSWSHTNCVIYPNGKRALVTINEKGYKL